MPGDLEYNRQSLRLFDHDYSEGGNYFITICTENHIFHFGAICENKMMLNEIGQIAKTEWYKLPDRFSQICLGPFCIMPNHVHGIVQITGFSPSAFPTPSFDRMISVGAGLAPARVPGEFPLRAGASPAPTEESNQKKGKKEKETLGTIVGSYKSLVMKACLAEHKAKFPFGSEVPLLGKIWQRNYYEHIIRTQQSYDAIALYIMTNAQHWMKDKFFKI